MADSISSFNDEDIGSLTLNNNVLKLDANVSFYSDETYLSNYINQIFNAYEETILSCKQLVDSSKSYLQQMVDISSNVQLSDLLNIEFNGIADININSAPEIEGIYKATVKQPEESNGSKQPDNTDNQDTPSNNINDNPSGCKGGGGSNKISPPDNNIIDAKLSIDSGLEVWLVDINGNKLVKLKDAIDVKIISYNKNGVSKISYDDGSQKYEGYVDSKYLKI